MKLEPPLLSQRKVCRRTNVSTSSHKVAAVVARDTPPAAAKRRRRRRIEPLKLALLDDIHCSKEAASSVALGHPSTW